MIGGILHTRDGGSGDRIVGAATGGAVHTGDNGSSDRRDTYTGDGVITLHYWNHYDGTIAIKFKKSSELR